METTWCSGASSMVWTSFRRSKALVPPAAARGSRSSSRTAASSPKAEDRGAAMLRNILRIFGGARHEPASCFYLRRTMVMRHGVSSRLICS
eukprot:scaffold368_cov258-Pinguiococcus_pyrenoidosus.AAC.35